jgi:hypothetical protein
MHRSRSSFDKLRMNGICAIGLSLSYAFQAGVANAQPRREKALNFSLDAALRIFPTKTIPVL